jgi:ABC-2 type transport system permease protein
MSEGFEHSPGGAIRAPLMLLIKVNLLTHWRRLKSVSERSRLLTTVISLFIGGYLILAYVLFKKGLWFLGRFYGFGTVLTERLIYLLFAFLFVLLLISNLVISFTNLFRNRETNFLLTMPLPTATVFQWKFIESTILASWAFVFLIAPLLVAFGLSRDVPWHFYPATLVSVGLFIILPAVAGAFLAVTIARFIDRRVFQIVTVSTLLVVIGSLIVWFRPEPVAEGESTETRVISVLERTLYRTKFSEFSFLPSRWLSSSVLQWADGSLWGAGFQLLVLLSYALFFGMLALSCMGRVFYDATSAVHSRGSVFIRWKWFHWLKARRTESRFGSGLADRAVALIPGLAPDVRAILVKDFRMFWRDTAQWAQSLMLFGLLAVYIFNLRHFSQQLGNPFWIHLVSFLNLGACSLNLATLTTRFVYPQFSLEGKRLWVVGMAPLGLVHVVKVKYWFANITALIVTLFLITMSCYMLDLSLSRTVFFAMAITVMTMTLTGLAVGLGALYPNFKEENPSKIVSGFGGTFCLVLSFLYILSSVVLLAKATPWSVTDGPQIARTAAYVTVFALLSFTLGWLPLHLGIRRVRTFEL